MGSAARTPTSWSANSTIHPNYEWVESTRHGHVEEFEFENHRLRNKRAVHVYLPPGYDEGAAPMPVMYLHDGGEYLSRARLPVVLDNLINTGEVASLIRVMVDPVNRMTEYRMNGAYADFVASELPPHIEADFARSPARRDAASCARRSAV
jgi:enterochelin esterase-like enzyme